MPRNHKPEGANAAEIEKWLAGRGADEIRDLKAQIARIEAMKSKREGSAPLWREKSFAVQQLAGMMLKLFREDDFALKGLICAQDRPMSYAKIGELLVPAVGGERVRQLYEKLSG